jgi:hypothetical protein
MINRQEIIHQMANQAEGIRVLAQTFAEAQTLWKPAPESWSLHEVLQHLYNEERMDFRWHLQTMFGGSPPPQGFIRVESSSAGLEGFLAERRASLAYLTSLQAPDWEVRKELRFGPNETMTLSTGEMLVAWLEHDILHLRQIVELMHGCNALEAAPYSVKYAGGW